MTTGGGYPAEPSENLYTVGWPLEVTDVQIQQLMSQYGTVVSCRVLPDNGRQNRASLIRMGDLSQAKWLVENLNQNMPVGLSVPITVRYQDLKHRAASQPPNSAFMGAMTPPPAAGFQAPGLRALPEHTMITGQVKIWYPDKAYGFLIPDGGGPDVFCHQKTLSDMSYLEPGSPVMFEVQLDPVKAGKYSVTKCFGAAGAAPGAAPAAVAAPVPFMTRGGQEPSNNVFIAGLPLMSTEDSVRALLGQYGAITQCRVLPESGKPDRASLVRFADVSQAAWVVENLNQNIPVGLTSPITVRFADNRVEKAKAAGIPMAARLAYGAAPGVPPGYGPAGQPQQFALMPSPYGVATPPPAAYGAYGVAAPPPAAAAPGQPLSPEQLAAALAQLSSMPCAAAPCQTAGISFGQPIYGMPMAQPAAGVVGAAGSALDLAALQALGGTAVDPTAALMASTGLGPLDGLAGVSVGAQ